MSTSADPTSDDALSASASASTRRDAVDAGLSSVRLEGFDIPPAMVAVNEKFVSGEITSAQRFDQALALCKGLEGFKSFGSDSGGADDHGTAGT